ncbi:hypothetical protein K491DRAFT_598695 [Lophiostoma macrostomum CBS 122681]|uniref:Uncharacterized protein n=1 Tax=Lophiostoma macrostomum CBS 122681 TaxID=1314788 RepID=A0A6A6T663_9PLEO|nr:hypothetical protein K491DRAFT_598695 [Lophiostoma macrostomum CBS 122681]
MPLKKRLKQVVDAPAGKEDSKKSKRQRIAEFFRSRKQKKEEEKAAATPKPLHISSPQDVPRDSKIAESNISLEKTTSHGQQEEQTQLPSPPPEPAEQDEETEQEQEKPDFLSEERLHTLFSGAPHFNIKKTGYSSIPAASYPWDENLATRDVSDSLQLAQPAFSAATLHRHLPRLHDPSEQDKVYQGYEIGVVEVPSMLSAQGIEPGSIGLLHFLELPTSDNLVTDLQESQSSNGYLEAVKNREQFQSNPEKLGIRKMDMNMVYDRLAELGDLIEAFQDSPERMTILNNQSSGDLYANLFGKFLTPPRYDDSADDPTGIKVQIDTLIKILKMRGFWYDFSLVEWRIRLGQVLWNDSDLTEEDDSDRLWAGRDIVLLQIMLACELLLRLDAVGSMDTDDIKGQMHVSRDDYLSFLDMKTKKTDWDLVLARRFLDNILVVKEGNADTKTQTTKARGLFSMLSRDQPESSLGPDIVLVPRHQARQLSGLVHFADALRWPGLDLVIKQLTQKLGLPDTAESSQQPPSQIAKFLEPSTPSAISVYGTPLATPRSTTTVRDSYFGHMAKPPRNRSNTQTSLTVPLSTTVPAQAYDSSINTANIGGWLSRSYLTGLVLPGEPIAHFLISTLLENDRLAISALGDSANLYGGFIYAERSWWSKSSIVGRVLACVEDAVECMGWITTSRLPHELQDGWYAISSQQVQAEHPARIGAEEDLLARDSVLVPNDNVRAEDLTLPVDHPTPPVPSIEFSRWKLSCVDNEPSEQDASSSIMSSDLHVASLTFTSFSRGTTHNLTLTHDVQLVTSFPCTPPSRSPAPSYPQVLKSSLSRSSSKRSIRSTRSGSNKRISRNLSRRNSHGFEPLLSHPPDSPGIAPTRVYSPIPDDDADDQSLTSPAPVKATPMMAHPLHISYNYKLVAATDVLDSSFVLPFDLSIYAASSLSGQTTPREEKKYPHLKAKTILVLDARASKDLELLARAWCAEKGLHAIIGRVGRTCLACCIREARGLSVGIVIRT